MRKKMIAGNWKMNIPQVGPGPDGLKRFIASVKKGLCCKINPDEVEVVLCVPYVVLQSVKDELGINSPIKVGSQNMHYMDDGEYTGEISGNMLKFMGINHVVIGHSERRERFAETDTTVNLKVGMALKRGITPIICVGESQRQNTGNRRFVVLQKQVSFALDELTRDDVTKTVFAYEPIWAIGTGLTPEAREAEEACKFIRQRIADKFDAEAAETVRVIYGGSVKPSNAKEFFSQPNIDGGLIGGASIKMMEDNKDVPQFIDVVLAGVCNG